MYVNREAMQMREINLRDSKMRAFLSDSLAFFFNIFFWGFAAFAKLGIDPRNQKC